jgi:type VI secretion system protein ImpC
MRKGREKYPIRLGLVRLLFLNRMKRGEHMGLSGDDNVQQKLTRVRPPRVKITYDVETGGAQRAMQLPFIVGIFANLSGDAGSPDLPIPYKQREFIEIDRDNIYDIMKASGASVNLASVALPPTVAGGDVEHDPTVLTFETLDDFLPFSVVKRVGRLAAHNAARGNVRMLQARAEIDDDLAAVLNRACAPDQAPLRKAISDKYTAADTAAKAAANGKTPASPTEGWRTIAVTPAATSALVPPAQLTADNVLEQLLGHLVTTQPPAAPAAAGANAAAAGANAAPAAAGGNAAPAAAGGNAAAPAPAPAAAGNAAAPAAAPTPADWGDSLALLGYFNSVVLTAIDAGPQPPWSRSTPRSARTSTRSCMRTRSRNSNRRGAALRAWWRTPKPARC